MSRFHSIPLHSSCPNNAGVHSNLVFYNAYSYALGAPHSSFNIYIKHMLNVAQFNQTSVMSQCPQVEALLQRLAPVIQMGEDRERRENGIIESNRG